MSEVNVSTSSGKYLYRIKEYDGNYYCQKWIEKTLFGYWNDIGKARSMDDALSIIKSHAKKYGSVYGLDIY